MSVWNWAYLLTLSCPLLWIPGPTLWDIDLANQIVQATNQMPRNGFEEMIQWTKEGKLWEYPINNEAGEFLCKNKLHLASSF